MVFHQLLVFCCRTKLSNLQNFLYEAWIFNSVRFLSISLPFYEFSRTFLLQFSYAYFNIYCWFSVLVLELIGRYLSSYVITAIGALWFWLFMGKILNRLYIYLGKSLLDIIQREFLVWITLFRLQGHWSYWKLSNIQYQLTPYTQFYRATFFTL